jgi:hypothetical protein
VSAASRRTRECPARLGLPAIKNCFEPRKGSQQSVGGVGREGKGKGEDGETRQRRGDKEAREERAPSWRLTATHHTGGDVQT